MTTPDLNRRISRARARVILRHPFYATILMDMDVDMDAGLDADATVDGERVLFRPDYVADASDDDLFAAMKKAAVHVAYGHHLRQGKREQEIWNEATDQVAWHIMQHDGDAMPSNATPQAEFADRSAEGIYQIMYQRRPPSGGGGQGQGGGSGQQAPQGGAGGPGQGSGGGQAPGQQPGASGPQNGAGQGGGQMQVRPHAAPHETAKLEEAERKRKQQVMRGQMAQKMAGQENIAAERLAEEIRSRQVPWEDKLHRYVDESARKDYSWRKPNRRFVHDGMYLPGEVPDGIGRLVLLMDTSGSISDFHLGVFQRELQNAVDAVQPDEVVVIHCDVAVQRVQRFQPGDKLDLTPVGGGGTDLDLGLMRARKERPTVTLIFTDLVFYQQPKERVGGPVLWCVWGNPHPTRSFAPEGELTILPDPERRGAAA